MVTLMQVSACKKMVVASGLHIDSLVKDSMKIDTKDKICEAAFELFCANGIRATSTREIAKAADINEVTLFRHFGCKENLIVEAVRRKLPPENAPRIELTLDKPIGEVLKLLFDTIQSKVMDDAEVILLISRNAHHFPQLIDILNEVREPSMKTIRVYFENQMELGKIRKMDSSVLVGLFFFPLSFIQLMGDNVASKNKVSMVPPDLSVPLFMKHHIEMFLDYILLDEKDRVYVRKFICSQ